HAALDTLSLHDALPIYPGVVNAVRANIAVGEVGIIRPDEGSMRRNCGGRRASVVPLECHIIDRYICADTDLRLDAVACVARTIRSEEHTSELQSRENLV